MEKFYIVNQKSSVFGLYIYIYIYVYIYRQARIYYKWFSNYHNKKEKLIN